MRRRRGLISAIGNSYLMRWSSNQPSQTGDSGVSRSLRQAVSFNLQRIIAGIAEFERELIQGRIRSGIAAANARGKRLGRQPGQRPKSDRLAPKVLALVAAGRSYRLISRELGLSKNTVLEIVKRNRAMSA